jgi:Domain of unknown function (DUF5666)
MFPVRTVALLVAVFAGTAFGQNTSPDKNTPQQKPATQQETAAPSQPQTKVLIPESDAAAANSPTDSNDPLLSVPPMPKGKTTLVGGQVRNIDQIRNRMDVDSFGGGHMRVNFDERTHFFRNGVETTQLAIHKGDRVYVDTMLDKTRVLARNVRVNTGGTAASASGQITRFDPKSGTLTLRDQIAARPVTFNIDQNTQLLADKNSGASTVTQSDLRPGAIIAVNFAPSGNRGVAKQVTVLALPGTVFTFVGHVTNLDMRGALAVDNQSDQKNYDIRFDPTQVHPSRSLVVGSQVVVKAQFDGQNYNAQSIEVE